METGTVVNFFNNAFGFGFGFLVVLFVCLFPIMFLNEWDSGFK